MEKATLRIIKLLPKSVKATSIDSHVWFKGFNLSNKKNKYKIDPLKILYSFNLADLYLLNDKLIIVGEIKLFGKIRLLSPFAICWTDRIFEPTSVKTLTQQINTKLVGHDIEIEFEDLDCSNTIKLVIKRIGHTFYEKMQSDS